MLKGHVFSEQLFENHIFALFMNTFLAGHNGIINGYKNSMNVTYSGSNVTVNSGVVCVQGRFLEEDSSKTINAGTNTLYCKLVITIDLTKTNTENDFQQGAYEILTGASAYPALTQQDIVNTNTGKYQFELAQFKTGLNGITDFVDKRTYLDFNSIYEELATQSILLHKSGGRMTGTLVSQDVIPNGNNQYNLGSAVDQFNIVYLNKMIFDNGHSFKLRWLDTGDLMIGIDYDERSIPIINGHAMRFNWDNHGLAVYIDNSYVGHVTLTRVYQST